MSSSLKDQLLKIGLIDEKKARQPQRKKRRGKKPELSPEDRERQALARAHAELKKQRDRELNAQRDQQKKAREQADWVRQMLGSHGLPKAGDADETAAFHFTLVTRVHRMHVTAEQRERLSAGKLAIVWFDGRYHLVPDDIGRKLAEKIPKRTWLADDDAKQPDDDDPYAGFEVPDDLVW